MFSDSTTKSTPSDSSFDAILNAALTKYANETGHDLCNHPLALEIDVCDSADSILALFQKKAKEFDDFRNGDSKLMRWIQPTVINLHALSINPTLNAAVSFVSASKILSFSDTFLMPLSFRLSPMRHQSFLQSVSFYLCVSLHTLALGSSDIGIIRLQSRLKTATTP
jgi:hypothetical protein